MLCFVSLCDVQLVSQLEAAEATKESLTAQVCEGV